MDKQIFIIGNKRSGTTLLAHLLNIHDDIFVSHESDIIWILKNMSDGNYDVPCYKRDACTGMKATLSALGPSIEYSMQLYPVKEVFKRVLLNLMAVGSAIQPTYEKDNPRILGDKKPVQHCDPSLRPFMYEHFPNAKFIHIIRHPFAVVSSKILYRGRKDREHVPEFWYDSPHEILARWVEHERWAMDMMYSGADFPSISIRLEDLTRNPQEVIDRTFKFLGVESVTISPMDMSSILRDPNDKFQGFTYGTSDKLLEIMKHYGYGVS